MLGVGFSYGGCMLTAIAGSVPQEEHGLCGLVSISGLFDMAAMMRHIAEQYAYPYGFANTKVSTRGGVGTVAAFRGRGCALFSVARRARPLVVLRVPIFAVPPRENFSGEFVAVSTLRRWACFWSDTNRPLFRCDSQNSALTSCRGLHSHRSLVGSALKVGVAVSPPAAVLPAGFLEGNAVLEDVRCQ